MSDGGKKPVENQEEKVFGSAATLRKQHKEKKPGNRRWIMLVSLVVVAGLAVGGIYLAQNVKPEAPAPTPTTAPTQTLKLIDKTRADFKEATVTLGLDSYTVELKADGTYGMKGAPSFKMDQTKASSLVGSLTYMLYDSTLEATDDLSIYGLKAPKAKVSVTYQDNTTRTFLLGDMAPTGYRYYLMEQGKPNVYIVYSSAGTNFTVTRSLMHTATMQALTVENISGATLVAKDKEPVTVGYVADKQSLGISSLYLTSPIEYEADSEKVNTYYTGITGIKLLGFETDALYETLSMYGLDTPRYHLTVMGQDAEGKAVTALELFIGNDKDETSTYARIDNTTDVYLLDRSTLAFLADITAAKLIDRFANIINIAKVDGMEVVGSDGAADKFTITRTPELDEAGNQKLNAGGQPTNIEDFTLNGETIADETFRKLYQVIIGTRVDGMIPDGKAPAADVKPVLTVKYTLNAVQDEETIEYLPYDADHYAVRRGGVCMFYILKTRVDQIEKAIDAYKAGTFDPKAFGV